MVKHVSGEIPKPINIEAHRSYSYGLLKRKLQIAFYLTTNLRTIVSFPSTVIRKV